jgi:hypothetical protein
MQSVKANQAAGVVPQTLSGKILFSALILIVLLAAGLYLFNAYQAFQPSLPGDTTLISQATLEEKYGLRVNLIAVTAVGGFVDVRLKMLDSEKARLLLEDKNNFPALLVGDDLVLNAPEFTKSKEISFVDGGNMFIMYPNSRNAIRPGTPVRILFGDIATEPVNAR